MVFWAIHRNPSNSIPHKAQGTPCSMWLVLLCPQSLQEGEDKFLRSVSVPVPDAEVRPAQNRANMDDTGQQAWKLHAKLSENLCFQE